MNTTRILSLLFAGAVSACAQPFTLGVRAGVPLTDFISTAQNPVQTFTSDTKPYTIGPTAELHLPFGLGVEVDALYHRVNYEGSASLANAFTSSRTTGNSWEFPLLVKYRFPSHILRPFVDAGPSWDTLTGLEQSVTRTVSSVVSTVTNTNRPAELKRHTTTGFVVGGGVEIHAVFLTFSPEVRYTRWGSEHFAADPSGLLHSNQNQAEFLLGITLGGGKR